MPTLRTKDALDRADARFRKQEQVTRERDAVWAEYVASYHAIDTKTAADLCDLVMRWHTEKRTVIAALHDLELVKSMFPEALLLAREPVAWGATRDVLTAENLLKARRMCEAFDEHAEACAA